MLAFFRAMSKSKIFLVILGLPLVASLLIFGNVSDVLGNITASDAVVKAGPRVITSPEFAKVFENAKKDAEQRAQRSISTEEAVAQGAIDSLLQDLASREALLAILQKAGIRPSDKILFEQMRKIPDFLNPVTGQFDAKIYASRLSQNGVKPETFEADAKDELTAQHFRFAIEGGLRAPAVYSALIAAAQLETRTFSGFYIDPRKVAPPALPTDAQLQAFIKQYSKELMKPERRSLTVVRFSAKAIEPSLKVDPAEVQRRFDFRKDTLSTPERRTVIQVPSKDAKTAQAVAARLKQGEDPRVVAKSLGVEPVVYTDAPRTGISDQRIAAAAFSMPSGAVSQPIQGSLGWAVIKVGSVTAGRAVTLDEVRPSIEAEARAEMAQERVYDVVQKYDDAQAGGSSLKEAAKAAGVVALELPPVTAQGADAQGRPQPLLSPKLLKSAFELPEGGESEVTDDGKGEYYAVRVEKVFAPALPTLAQDRDGLVRAYMQLETAKKVKAYVDTLAARVRKGESMDAVAASAGAALERRSVDLRTAQADQSQIRQLYAMVFSGKAGDVNAAGPTVVKIESVKPGSTLQAASVVRMAQSQMRGSLFKDMAGDASRWARAEVKVKVDEARARKALGLEPVAAPKDGAADKGAGK